MRIIYPLNPLNHKQADEPYQKEFTLLKQSGIQCSLFDYDELDFDKFNPSSNIENGESILYRGWMLNPARYQKLITFINKKGGTPITSYEDYLKCHHLPNWYESCTEYTPETKFFVDNNSLKANIKKLGWGEYFVKDYVKSNSTEKGSIATSPQDVLDIIELIKEYRGEIEGGIAIRRVEHYKPETEIRYFVFNGKAYSPNGSIPEIVINIAKKIKAPFYSIDIIQRLDGEYRLVELGDGQVSDKKTWNVEDFIKILIND